MYCEGKLSHREKKEALKANREGLNFVPSPSSGERDCKLVSVSIAYDSSVFLQRWGGECGDYSMCCGLRWCKNENIYFFSKDFLVVVLNQIRIKILTNLLTRTIIRIIIYT